MSTKPNSAAAKSACGYTRRWVGTLPTPGSASALTRWATSGETRRFNQTNGAGERNAACMRRGETSRVAVNCRATPARPAGSIAGRT